MKSFVQQAFTELAPEETFTVYGGSYDGTVFQNEGAKPAKQEFDLVFNALNLKQTITTTQEEITHFATQCRATLTEYADQYKLAGWVKKAARAERMVAGNENDEDIALLQAECDKRGADETPEALAQKQLKKSKSLDMAIAVIDGLESAALTQIEQCTTIEAIEICLQELKNQAEQELSNLTGENT